MSPAIHAVLAIAVMAVVTFLTRALPFLLFDRGESPPKLVLYLGRVLPPAIIAMLIVYCLRSLRAASLFVPAGWLPQVIAVAAVRAYATVEDILQAARDKGEPPLLVVCDELSDPHNLGAVIRTAECAGAHGVIIPKRRSAGLRRPDRRGGQDLRRGGLPPPRGPGGQPALPAQAAQGGGPLDLWLRRRRNHLSVRG